MLPGQVVYFLCDDTIEVVKLLDNNQHTCAIELNGQVVCVQENTLTTHAYAVIQHIDKQIAKHESRIAILKAARQDFQPPRLMHEI
jgi:hypothetical protein